MTHCLAKIRLVDDWRLWPRPWKIMVTNQPAFFGRHGHLCLISLLGEEAKQNRKVWCKWHVGSETRTACFQSVSHPLHLKQNTRNAKMCFGWHSVPVALILHVWRSTMYRLLLDVIVFPWVQPLLRIDLGATFADYCEGWGIGKVCRVLSLVGTSCKDV